ncbi:DUF4240 domain-containing protein [Dactylosporangium sp. AC04546]|uniref:DUF4240 domain-containing protein n=1 Tax=Dactylosporangium sp. AC04546 TaxID=2862460 RepID=UPI001EDFFB71|nr:DUF4240 domain-containing protein [Dactylosporangium sp. AC04546]WVK84987.1 DUF4240 domain-containing protein [Dactylosporangium sp. AC04546]
MTDFVAVDSENFWSIIDGARSAAGDRVTPGFAERFTAALRMRLATLDKSELLNFDARRTELQARANSPAMWATGRIVARFADAFVDGLIARGRDVYERAVADPDALADDPVVRAVAAGELPAHELAPREVEDLAEELYGEEDDYPMLLRARTGQVAPLAADDWDDEDDQAVRKHLPKVCALFLS